MLYIWKRLGVTLCRGESTGLYFAVYEEKGGCHPMSWGEYRAVFCCIQGKGWLTPCVLERVQGCPLLYMQKGSAVTLCPGESTRLFFNVYEEKGGCLPVSWREYRSVLCCIRGKGWLYPCVLGRVQGYPLLYMMKKVAVTLCSGESTRLSYVVYEERGGCNPVSWGQDRAVPCCIRGKG